MGPVEQIESKAKTSIWGLDNILSGGFSRGHLFLVEGAPGTGEKCRYITLSETEHELRDGEASHGWTLGDGIDVFELLPPENPLDSEQQQDLLSSSDLEHEAMPLLEGQGQ
jgi:circadian clock protein KaiC